MESNLELIDKCYVCGRMCLVNGNPHIPLSEMNVSIDTLRALRCKYDMPLLNGNVTVCLCQSFMHVQFINNHYLTIAEVRYMSEFS